MLFAENSHNVIQEEPQSYLYKVAIQFYTLQIQGIKINVIRDETNSASNLTDLNLNPFYLESTT